MRTVLMTIVALLMLLAGWSIPRTVKAQESGACTDMPTKELRERLQDIDAQLISIRVSMTR